MNKNIEDSIKVYHNSAFDEPLFRAELKILNAELESGNKVPIAFLYSLGDTEDQAVNILIQAWDAIVEKGNNVS